jgi:molecular chaperone DnaJ
MATAERDYYEILGVDRSASDGDIKKAFRRLARELHPDVSDAPDAHERFREVAEAYEVLSNPETRETYDRFGRAGLRSGGFAPADFDLGNLSDIFSAFFGESLFGQSRGGAVRPDRGADVTAVVEIALAEAYAGITVDVPVRVAVTCDGCSGNGAAPGTTPVTCETCGGAGRVQHVSRSAFGQFVRSGTCPRCGGAGRIVETPCEQCEGVGRLLDDRALAVDVPAGIHDGQRIRLRGEGHAGSLGGPAGDVFVQVRVRPQEGLERDGDDLHTLVELTMTQAALGASASVPHPDGEVELEVLAGTQPGDVQVVRGRGMPTLSGGRHGDLHVHVAVRVPRHLTDDQRSLVEQLDGTLDDGAYRDDDDGGGFFERLKSALR